MVFGGFLERMGAGPHRDNEPEPAPEETSGPPTKDRLTAALDATEELVKAENVPSPVTARALRITAAVRDTLPRLDTLGAGSTQAYNVMATATDYLPDAVNGYLRLPRRFADTRPVSEGRTSLLVLIDQLDLLGATMDRVFDAVYRDDAQALVAHGAFLQEKFGRGSTGGALRIGAGETAIPSQAEADSPETEMVADEPAARVGENAAPPPPSTLTPPSGTVSEPSLTPPEAEAEEPDTQPPAPQRLDPPRSSLDL